MKLPYVSRRVKLNNFLEVQLVIEVKKTAEQNSLEQSRVKAQGTSTAHHLPIGSFYNELNALLLAWYLPTLRSLQGNLQSWKPRQGKVLSSCPMSSPCKQTQQLIMEKFITECECGTSQFMSGCNN